MGVVFLKYNKVSGFERVYQADCFQSDFLKLFGKSKNAVNRHWKYLYRCIRRLDQDGLHVLTEEQFEYINGTNNPKLYAIRHPHSILNERYIFFANTGRTFILLTAFKEKSGKDYYAPNIERANNIIAQLEDI